MFCKRHAAVDRLVEALRYVQDVVERDGYEDVLDKVKEALQAVEGQEPRAEKQ